MDNTYERMEIIIERNGNIVIIKAKGRIDAVTANAFADAIEKDIHTAEELVFDFSDVEYISSAGLRVLLTAQKEMDKRNCVMTVTHVKENVMDIFENSGFTNFIDVEEN